MTAIPKPTEEMLENKLKDTLEGAELPQKVVECFLQCHRLGWAELTQDERKDMRNQLMADSVESEFWQWIDDTTMERGPYL
jgi:hypothetical protein